MDSIEGRRVIRAWVFAIVTMLLAPHDPARAQSPTGSISGSARIAGADAPMAFGLVRLVRVGPDRATLQQSVTSADGHFRFVNVPAGDYQLQLLRIGFRPTLSPSLTVGPGQSVNHDLTVLQLPIELPMHVVSAERRCFTAGALSGDAELVALWDEARKGVETRHAFDQRYRYKRRVEQEQVVHMRLRGARRKLTVDSATNEPDSVLVRERRARAGHLERGYGEGQSVIIPTEKELLDEAFLQEHCLESPVEREAGTVGIRFRPARPRERGYGLRGVIWLDSATYLIRRLEFEHLDGDEGFTAISVQYADLPLGGRDIRLPTGGSVVVRVRGAMRLVASRSDTNLRFSYWGFEEAGAAR